MFLVACDITVSVDVPVNRMVVIDSAFRTNYSYGGQSVICDDRVTQFEYEIQYRGEIERIDSYLIGSRSGYRHKIAIHTPKALDDERGFFSGYFSVRSGLAPLSAIEGEFRSQAISVNPREPEIIGYSVLELEINPRAGDRVTTLRSSSIPILDFCD